MNTETTKFEVNVASAIAPDARVWIYQAERSLSAAEVDAVSDPIHTFVKGWKAHGAPLSAHAQIFFGRFICLFVDERFYGASGCSIDSSVRLIQNLEKELSISLMQRMDIALIAEDDSIKTIHVNDVGTALSEGEISGETLIFDNTVKTKMDFEKTWLKPIGNSWLKRFMP